MNGISGAMEQLIIGAILTAITGLAFIAYRHPDSFQVVWVVLSLVGGVVFIAITVWNISSYTTFEAISEYMNTSSRVKAQEAVEKIRVGYWIALGSYIAFMVYLGILLGLPQLLGLSSDQKATEEDQG